MEKGGSLHFRVRFSGCIHLLHVRPLMVVTVRQCCCWLCDLIDSYQLHSSLLLLNSPFRLSLTPEIQSGEEIVNEASIKKRQFTQNSDIFQRLTFGAGNLHCWVMFSRQALLWQLITTVWVDP